MSYQWLSQGGNVVIVESSKQLGSSDEYWRMKTKYCVVGRLCRALELYEHTLKEEGTNVGPYNHAAAVLYLTQAYPSMHRSTHHDLSNVLLWVIRRVFICLSVCLVTCIIQVIAFSAWSRSAGELLGLFSSHISLLLTAL